MEHAPFVVVSESRRRRLAFVWSDGNILDDLPPPPRDWIEATSRISPRARITLGAAMFEWLHARFEHLHGSHHPAFLRNAFWCVCANPRALAFFDLGRDDWPGPVLGPLWCAASWLGPGIRLGGDFPGDLDDAMEMLVRLCIHVLPDRDSFLKWFEAALDRLAQLSPAQPEDPFADLFDARATVRFGHPLGWMAVDPAHPFDSQADAAWLVLVTTAALRDENPYVDVDELALGGLSDEDR